MYHANLLKKYHQQEESRAGVAIDRGVVFTGESVDGDLDTKPEVDDNLVEIGLYAAKESLEDVTAAPILTETQRAEFVNCAEQFFAVFTEAPGTTNLIKHHIILKTDEPVRCKPTQYLTAFEKIRKETLMTYEDGCHQRIQFSVFFSCGTC